MRESLLDHTGISTHMVAGIDELPDVADERLLGPAFAREVLTVDRPDHTRPSGLDAHGLGTILSVWAHPDDESFAAGGLLAAASDAGSSIVCLTATRGELGTTDPEGWHPERLARVRSRELAAALAVLGVHELRWLPFNDGACDQVAAGRGMALVSRAIREVRPDTIVTFGPDGLTGHADHRAVSRWTSNAWAATGSTARLLWTAVPQSAADRMAQVEPFANAFYPGYPQVTRDRDISLHVDLSGDLLDRKVVALRSHATQSAAMFHGIGEDAFRSWLSTESFTEVATPAVRRSTATAAAPTSPTSTTGTGVAHPRPRRSLAQHGPSCTFRFDAW